MLNTNSQNRNQNSSHITSLRAISVLSFASASTLL